MDEKQKQVAEGRNITEWWKAISWYRKKREIASNTIKNETWLEHFKSLLEGVDEYIEEAEEKKREEQADEWTYKEYINRKV